MLAITRRGTGVRAGDEGMALVGVLGTLLIISAFLLATLNFTLQNLKPTRQDQDAKAAVAAAQAGIDDYVARLNASPGYWRRGNIDAANAALPNGATATWPGTVVPGTNLLSTTYRYHVLSLVSDIASQGVIRLRSVGTSRDVSRALTAQLSSRGFLQFTYHTDLETMDPVLYTAESDWQRQECTKYHWQGRPSGCTDISFGGGDVINGPLHTNDSIRIASAVTFSDPITETSWPLTGGTWTPPASDQLWWGSGGAPGGNLPVYAAPVQIPSENVVLRDIADPTKSAEGCIYTGATEITFTGTTMTILSPNTTAASVPSRCYNVNASNKAASQAGLAIPSVIFVEDKAGECVKEGANVVSLGYPLPAEYVGEGPNEGRSEFSGDYRGPVYGCAKGTAYVRGTIDAANTVATTQDVVVVGNLNYQSEAVDSDDVLGLIPAHFAWVYHPVRDCDGVGGCNRNYKNMLQPPVTEIDAALLTVKDSFAVQNYDIGEKISTNDATRLRVFGAIAQKYRGAVAILGETGYVKNYIYDTRFQKAVQPPYFLQPVSAQWAISQVSDG